MDFGLGGLVKLKLPSGCLDKVGTGLLQVSGRTPREVGGRSGMGVGGFQILRDVGGEDERAADMGGEEGGRGVRGEHGWSSTAST